MNPQDFNYTNPLDTLRLNRGIEDQKAFFRDLLRKNPGSAADLINDKSLSFPSLFILQDRIKDSRLVTRLNTKSKTALKLVDGILSKRPEDIHKLSSENKDMTFSALQWMLETGYQEDGLSNRYDEVMEKAAILLVKEHKDKTMLPAMVDMLFKRYKNGRFFHDLAWAFFEARDTDSLLMVVNRLRSPEWKEVQLAKKLLSFIPGIDSGISDTSRLHRFCMNWLQENHPFLVYTGESFQESCKPVPYTVLAEAKYLCKAVPGRDAKFLNQAVRLEHTLLDNFNKLDESVKTRLSDYSYRLYRQNPRLWNLWIQYPLAVQIRMASAGMGGIS